VGRRSLQQLFVGAERQLADSQIVDDQQGHGHHELHVLFVPEIQALSTSSRARLVLLVWHPDRGSDLTRWLRETARRHWPMESA
jgi:hypothetical protein